MECGVELTEAEKKTLRQLSRRHPHQDFRTRGLGLLELARGRRVNEIAVELEVRDKWLYKWAHAWSDKGLCGLSVGHKGRRRAPSQRHDRRCHRGCERRIDDAQADRNARRGSSWHAVAMSSGNAVGNAKARRVLLRTWLMLA
jgi:hypothetical protein